MVQGQNIVTNLSWNRIDKVKSSIGSFLSLVRLNHNQNFNLLVNMESASSQRPARGNSMKIFQRNLLYYVVHLILVTAVSLPTIFYLFQPDHPSHSSSNGTISNATGSEGTVRFYKHERAARNLTSNEDVPHECNSPLILDQESGQCRPPCSWTTQSPLTQEVYFNIIVVGLWAALIATVITFITWACIKNLRKFPHVLRFHIIICCIVLANSKMMPVHLSPKKTFCRDHMFWEPAGQSSMFTTISGAISHYFGLAHSFWAMCFVANTYGVIIHHNKAVFRHPVKIHLIQSALSWLVPATIVGSCVFLAPPGYKFYFMDLMTAGMASIRMAYFAVTLPMQITLGMSLCLLWSVVWHLRKARLDTTKSVIRAEEERLSMRRVERQFLSMAVVMLFVVGLVLSINTVTLYRVENFVHEAEVYFNCLQASRDCKSPSYNTVLPVMNIVAPSFACIAFFFLLFMNKECRQIWKDCFEKCKKIFQCCKPPPRKIRAGTDRSRCSSTLSVLSDRRASELFTFNTVDPILKVSHPYLFPSQVTRTQLEKPRSSTLTLPVSNQRMTVSNVEVEIRVTPPELSELDGRVRCNSVPVFAPNDEDIEKINFNLTSLNSPSRDSSVLGSNSSLESDLNSDTQLEKEAFIQDIDACSSKL